MIEVHIRPSTMAGYKSACRWLVERGVHLPPFNETDPQTPTVTMKLHPDNDHIVVFIFPNSLKDTALLFKLSWGGQ